MGWWNGNFIRSGYDNSMIFELNFLGEGMFVFWVWWFDLFGFFICVLCGVDLIDVICKDVLMLCDFFEFFDFVVWLKSVLGVFVGSFQEIVGNFKEVLDLNWFYLLVLLDLQVIKVCGVIFVFLMLEWVIEEQVKGDLVKVDVIWECCIEIFGDSL